MAEASSYSGVPTSEADEIDEGSTRGLTAAASGLSLDAGHHVASLDQSTFFRAVNNGSLTAVSGLLKNREVDVNAYNDEGVTALLLAVYHYEDKHNADIAKLLLEYGADVNGTMDPNAPDKRICIVKEQKGPLGGGASSSFVAGTTNAAAAGLGATASALASEQHCTKKISLQGKAPLLVALELKSALYVRGWEYRHWDKMLLLLASATVAALKPSHAPHPHDIAQKELASQMHINARASRIADGWAAVFESGKHETVEVWAEGKHLDVLKLLLSSGSKMLKSQVDATVSMGQRRIELKEASFTVVKTMMQYLYTGRVEATFLRQRGIDLLLAAHKYKFDSLKEECETQLHTDPDNWIKFLSAALEVGSKTLVLACAESIWATMKERKEYRHMEQYVFAEKFTPHGGIDSLPPPLVTSKSLDKPTS